MKYFDKKAKSLWIDNVIADLEKIEVEPGTCRYNYRCHNNAIHDAINNKDEKVAVVIYLENGCPILHYVNYTKGKFVDNTLGHFSQFNDYYLLRWINKDQFNNEALEIFTEIRNLWEKKIPWIWRWLVDITI